MNANTLQKNIWIIVGGGAAGLAAAVALGRAGETVLLLEQNDRVGKKILVSGNGRCNIGNRHIEPGRFHSRNTPFVMQVLDGYGADRIIAFFRSIGLELTEGKAHQLFPMSLQAGSVVDLLAFAAREAGVTIQTDCRVQHIDKTAEGFTLQTTQGEKTATHLMIASGSVAAPQLGGSDSGYLFAAKMGHTLIPRHPVLVPLHSAEQWIKRCSGLKIRGRAKLYANGAYITERTGDLLFTDYGISGLAVLDISSAVSVRLADNDTCELRLDVMPDRTQKALVNLMLECSKPTSSKPLALWLQGILHKKLIPVIIKHSGTQAQTEADLNRKEINRLVHTIKNLKLRITDTRGFRYAEAAMGGVDTTEVNPHTLESKRVPHLFFGGEVLDVDGDRGGFNFHFAWTCGLRVGGTAPRLGKRSG